MGRCPFRVTAHFYSRLVSFNVLDSPECSPVHCLQ
jgi:hypothetical protein